MLWTYVMMNPWWYEPLLWGTGMLWTSVTTNVNVMNLYYDEPECYEILTYDKPECNEHLLWRRTGIIFTSVMTNSEWFELPLWRTPDDMNLLYDKPECYEPLLWRQNGMLWTSIMTTNLYFIKFFYDTVSENFNHRLKYIDQLRSRAFY